MEVNFRQCLLQLERISHIATCNTVDQRVKLASCYASCLDDELSCLFMISTDTYLSC